MKSLPLGSTTTGLPRAPAAQNEASGQGGGDDTLGIIRQDTGVGLGQMLLDESEQALLQGGEMQPRCS